jgi:hypothetical protein
MPSAWQRAVKVPRFGRRRHPSRSASVPGSTPATWAGFCERLFRRNQNGSAGSTMLRRVAPSSCATAVITRSMSELDLAGGRVLLFFPDEQLADGASAEASKGFIDRDNTPPWDIWLWTEDATRVHPGSLGGWQYGYRPPTSTLRRRAVGSILKSVFNGRNCNPTGSFSQSARGDRK